MTAPDITKQPTLYVVPYAHLDTQWRWEFPQVISEYLLKTMRVNFDYIDKYPHYVFNWTGSNRYRLMKEYYPADYAKLKEYVAKGNWFPAGSSVEEGDVNLPSAESIIRQVLYGNTYYRNEFGKASAEYMLPDCFGFPASLPTILAHAGVKGFSTQKLSSAWQPAPIDGRPGFAGENAGRHSVQRRRVGRPGRRDRSGRAESWRLRKPHSHRPEQGASGCAARDSRLQPPPQAAAGDRLVSRINIDGKATGVFADYHYVGTGDIGGAADEESVRLLEATVTQGEAVLPGSDFRGGNLAVLRRKAPRCAWAMAR
jgi:alpha-mannosidase